MSIDFLEYLRLQFPWLVMPSTNPFSQATTGIPDDPTEVPPIIVRPGPSGGIGQDVQGIEHKPPEDTRTPEQKREDERKREKEERELEETRKRWAKERERQERESEARKRINPEPKPLSGQTEAEKKRSEVFRRLMEQKVIIGPPQRPGTSGESGVLKASASTDDDGDPLRELEGEWRDPRSLPYPPGFFADREGGSYDPDVGQIANFPTDQQREIWADLLKQLPFGKEQTPITGLAPIPPEEVGASVHEDTTLASQKPPGDWMSREGDPLEYLTPGTAQWKEKQAFDRRDALVKQAYDLNEKWGVDLRDELNDIVEEEFGKAQQAVDTAFSPEQGFVDQFAQVPTTERQQTINDQWEEVIRKWSIRVAEVETQKVVDTVVNEVLDRRWAGDPTGLAKGLFDPDTDHARAVAREIEHGAAWEGLPDDEWDALRETQQHADPVTEEQLEKIKAALYDKTQEFLKSLPDEVTIYRFGPQREGESIASFTLDPGYNYLRDLPWAERAQAQGEQFLTYKVDKKDILFYTDMQRRPVLDGSVYAEFQVSGGEQEIFVDFSKVRLDENAPPSDPPEWRGINPT